MLDAAKTAIWPNYIDSSSLKTLGAITNWFDCHFLSSQIAFIPYINVAMQWYAWLTVDPSSSECIDSVLWISGRQFLRGCYKKPYNSISQRVLWQRNTSESCGLALSQNLAAWPSSLVCVKDSECVTTFSGCFVLGSVHSPSYFWSCFLTLTFLNHQKILKLHLFFKKLLISQKLSCKLIFQIEYKYAGQN